MHRQFSRLTFILLLSLVNTIVLQISVKAQDSDVGCRQAVANAKTRLKSVPNVLIEDVYTKNNSEFYSDAPAERPIQYIFYLTGPKRNGRVVENGIKKVENSTQFMKNISSDIISKCPSVRAVSFSSTLHPTCIITFGLMQDGQIKAFDYMDDPDRDVKWGEAFCW